MKSILHGGILMSLLFLVLLLNVHSASIKSSNEPQWKLDATVDGVDFYAAISKCDKVDVVYLKLANRNRYNVEVGWNEVIRTQLQNSLETAFKKIVVKPGESFESDCHKIILPELVVLSTGITPTYLPEIRSFSFKNISVKKTN